MLCPNCGKNIEDESKYCLDCGAQIEDNSEPVVVYSVRNQHTDTPPKSFRKWVIAGAIVLVVVLLAGAGWGVMSWKQKEDLRNAIEHEWLGEVSADALSVQMLQIDEHHIEYGIKSVGFGYTHLITYDWKPINKNTIRVWISPDTYRDCAVEVSEVDLDDGSTTVMWIEPALTSTDPTELWIKQQKQFD